MIDFTQCKMLDITRYGINNLAFYKMQAEELRSAIVVLKKQIENYTPSISGICLADQQRHSDNWAAFQNATYYLNLKHNEQSGS